MFDRHLLSFFYIKADDKGVSGSYETSEYFCEAIWCHIPES